ncbi:zinc finger protein 62-like [Pecten maximus]|uniref:zinc finger protein 62-like n=1 Tax=Pecten maximus TaxID=6579 RepID=UPI001458E44C|nr:zinc finger protein 62-like [Pecten maximus]XP_033728572.1 zinc finger protein 62-like [Pecten maximus]XP_033728573.1 zinc finger protein 62-like [Pecten maximus]
MDISKSYNNSVSFLIQERQRLQGLSKSQVYKEKDLTKISMAESFMNGRSASPIGHGFESVQFKNDVMFSSASMSESSADGRSTSGNESKITTPSLINAGDNIVFSERFGQNVSTDLSVTDMKKEPVSDDEEAVDSYYQTNSQTVFPGMITSSIKTESDLGVNSAQSESSQDNVSLVIKQEPLTDDDDINDNGVENDVFGDYLLKSNDMDDDSSTSMVHQSEEHQKKRKNTMIEIASSSKRVKRNATGKLYNKFGDEFHMDKVDDLDEDSVPIDTNTEEEYTPSYYIDQKEKTKETENTEMNGKTPFSFENLEGNTLNIKGTSKNLHVKIFKCPECHDIFTYESVFKKHMRKHTGDLPFKCKHCKLGFMTQFSHDVHSRVHTSDKRYKCGVCGEKMKLKKELKEHNANHTLTKKAQDVSNLPVKIEPTSITGENENLSDVGLSPFGCSMCAFVAKDFAEIGNHVMESHFVDRRCFCDICSRRFANTDDLKIHKTLHDGQYEEVSCGICEEIVDSKEDLMKHLDIHPEAKPYRCCHCGDKFIVLTQLRNHMQTHSFTKRYNCPHCLKQFFHEDTLESHLRVHTGEISYTCPVCDKGFRAKDRLRIHMRQHPVPYSLFSNYENKVIDNTGDAISSKKEIQKMDAYDERNVTDFQESNRENDNTTESRKLDSNVELSSSNVYLDQLKIRMKNTSEEENLESLAVKADSVTIKQEPDIEENTENLGIGMDINCRDDLYGKSGEIVNSFSDSNVFEKLRKQGSIDGSQLQTSGTTNTGTPFCISVKKLTKVAIPNKSTSTKCTSAKQSNTGMQFTEMEDTMNLQMNIHQCIVCGAMFAYNNMLKKHMMKHAGKEPYKCDTCGHGCMSSSALKAHSMVHSGERPYVCDKCPKAFRQKSGLKSHLLTHSAEKTFECKRCKKTFKDSCLFQRHRKGHCEPDAFGCSICNTTFKDIASILSHVSSVHFNGQTDVCDVCSNRFDSLQSLEEHQTIHLDSKTYTCGICSNEFTDKDELSTHMTDHPIANPFKCQICCKRYRSATSLSSHVESHLTDGSVLDTTSSNNLSAPETRKKPEQNTLEQSGKQFPCKYCNQVFSSGVQRWAHSAVHDKARPYSCSICGKRYINKGSLASHEESHENPKGKKSKCSGETLGRMKDLVEQNKSPHTFDEGQTKKKVEIKKNSSRSAKKKKQMKEKDSMESSDIFEKEQTLLSSEVEAGNIDSDVALPDTMNESYDCKNSTHDFYDQDCSFIKTEPISVGYPETETNVSSTEPISTGYSETETDIGEANVVQRSSGAISALDTSSESYQPEIKTEQDMDECDAIKPTYACSICGKTFVNQQKLELHENSHSTVIPDPVELICTECGADFWKQSDLNKHIRKHHNETNKPSFKSKLKKIRMKDSTLRSTS